MDWFLNYRMVNEFTLASSPQWHLAECLPDDWMIPSSEKESSRNPLQECPLYWRFINEDPSLEIELFDPWGIKKLELTLRKERRQPWPRLCPANPDWVDRGGVPDIWCRWERSRCRRKWWRGSWRRWGHLASAMTLHWLTPWAWLTYHWESEWEFRTEAAASACQIPPVPVWESDSGPADENYAPWPVGRH